MRLISTLVFTMMAFIATSQIVIITEIMYNPPESGNDSLEYIELYNPGIGPLDLSGYTMSGVTHTFENTLISPNTYICVCINANAMMSVFGKTCVQWTGGALSNSGETIQILDAANTVIDEVTYSNAAPWPSAMDGTAGNGASIVVCDVFDSNNALPESWQAAVNNTGIEINGKILRGSPAENNVLSSCTVAPDHSVLALATRVFSPRELTINVGETVRFINVGGGFHNVNGNKDVFPNNPISFGNGAASSSDWTYDFTFFQEGTYEYRCDPHAGDGMKGKIIVGLTKTYPVQEISTMKGINAAGIADSIGKTCELRGVVHGPNFTSIGLSFFIIDSNHNGISVSNLSNTLAYNVKEGDQVSVKGTIGQFRGLTQLVADVIIPNGTGPLRNAITVDSLGENTEAKLIKLKNMTLVDPTQWRGDGTSFNVAITNGTYTTQMRIWEFTDLASQPAPSGPFNVTGIGSQFDFNEPYTEFYQIFPRYKGDITGINSTDDQSLKSIVISPNPTSGIINLKGITKLDQVVLSDLTGRKLRTWQNPGEVLDISHFEGAFILSMYSGSNIRHEKIIVQP